VNVSTKEDFMRTRLMLIAGLVLGLGLAGPATALEVGEKAPDFTLAGTGGKQVKLSEMLGKGPIVLYTFIQAFTGT
jgi:peroxiredoxin Q/BCP